MKFLIWDTVSGTSRSTHFYLCLPCMQFPKQFPKTWKINRNSGRLLIRNCLVEFGCFGVIHGNVFMKWNSCKLLSVLETKIIFFKQKVKMQLKRILLHHLYIILVDGTALQTIFTKILWKAPSSKFKYELRTVVTKNSIANRL